MTRGTQRVTIQFHPNWPHGSGMVIESLARDGGYRSQFATGISNGGLTAHVGGDRWRWESRLFDGRYDAASSWDRPVYGAWNRMVEEAPEGIWRGRSGRNRSERPSEPQGMRATATRYQIKGHRTHALEKSKGLLQRERPGAHPPRPRSRNRLEGVP